MLSQANEIYTAEACFLSKHCHCETWASTYAVVEITQDVNPARKVLFLPRGQYKRRMMGVDGFAPAC